MPRRQAVVANTATYRLGNQLAFAAVPARVKDYAAAAARDFYARQIQSDFTEQVDTWSVPRGFGRLDRLWRPPADVLARAGFAAMKPASAGHWVLTAGVDPHLDDYYGPTLLWTIHNDGLEFWQQGGKRRVPEAGDVMVFDDALPHSMDLPRSRQSDPAYDEAVWIGWAVQIRRFSG